MHDYHNGTADTLYQLIGYVSEDEFTHEMYKELAKLNLEYGSPDYDNCRLKWVNKRRSIYSGLVKEIIDWIDSDEWVNYLELNDYIFVHSWIPVKEYIDLNKSLTIGKIVKTGPDEYREDWRNATQDEWNDAMWGCPWKKAYDKLNKTGKIIVCGHWHTSDFFNHLTKQHKTIYECPIFKSNKYKLIGLDACTAGSHKVNVLKLNVEDEELRG